MADLFRVLSALLFLAGAGAAAEVPPADPLEAAPFSVPPEGLRRAAEAAGSGGDANAVVLLEEAAYSFDDAGLSTYRWHAVIRLDTPAGVEEWSSLETDWSPWTEERPSLRARVITRGGSEHRLDPGTIVEAPAGEASGEVYSDHRILRVPLPAVEPGAVVEEEIVVREKTLGFDAGASFVFQFGGDDPARKVRLVIEAPAALPLRYVARLLPALRSGRSESGGRVRLSFEAGPLAPLPDPEPGLPPDVPAAPAVSFSTGRSWKDVASRYGELVEAQVRSADLKELAAEAGAGAEGREAVAAKLLERIHRDLRYTALELGESSIVPRTPAETLQRRYGDCKDQAALLIALLRARDIPARAVLLSSGPGPDPEPELPGLDWFDHVIVQIPGTPEIWIDPTDRYARAGELPLADQGRWALVADASTTGLVRTPHPTSADNRLVETREFFLAEEGPARIVERTEASGSFESDYRSTHHEHDRKEIEKTLEHYVRSTYLAKKLTRWESGDPLDLSKPFWLRLEASGDRGHTDGREAAVALYPSKLTAQLPWALTGEREEDDEDLEEQVDADRPMPIPGTPEETRRGFRNLRALCHGVPLPDRSPARLRPAGASGIGRDRPRPGASQEGVLRGGRGGYRTAPVRHREATARARGVRGLPRGDR